MATLCRVFRDEVEDLSPDRRAVIIKRAGAEDWQDGHAIRLVDHPAGADKGLQCLNGTPHCQISTGRGSYGC